MWSNVLVRRENRKQLFIKPQTTVYICLFFTTHFKLKYLQCDSAGEGAADIHQDIAWGGHKMLE